MMYTRRDVLRLGGGAAASAVLAGLGLMGSPREAEAIIGVDDALLGAVVLAIASLGGYALYSQYVNNNSLQGLGAGFSSYVGDSSNRVAAAAAAAQIAATYGVNTTQARLEAAAELIANGQGAFADAMESAATTGRLALDGLVSGSDDIVGAMRELVAGYFTSGALRDVPQVLPGQTVVGADGLTTVDRALGVMTLTDMLLIVNGTNPINGATEGYLYLDKNWDNTANSTSVGTLFVGNGAIGTFEYITGSNYNYKITHVGTCMKADIRHRTNPSRLTCGSFSNVTSASTFQWLLTSPREIYVSPGLLRGPLLPGVDVPADVPDVIGAAWDSLPIATDMVIDPTTGDITSAGSITLPTGVPSTAEDYAAALQGMLAGVVAGTVALPVGLDIPVTVATPTGVATMPISDAIATETSLELDYAPSIPINPVIPPTTVPEGPWTPAVELPFMNVWPFNMIYTFVETMGRLGN